MLRQNGEPRGDHPTQKPIGVMNWILRQLPPCCTTILDPFMGSGTTGVACIKLGRKFIGIELEPKYFDITCRRIEDEMRQLELPFDRQVEERQETWLEMWAKPFDWSKETVR